MSKCLVVPTIKIKSFYIWQKLFVNDAADANVIFLDDSDKKNIYDFINKNGLYIERFGSENLEQDQNLQQIICYFVIRKETKFYAYIRSEKNKNYLDSRMSEKISVGLGGHIYKEDGRFNKAIFSRLKNEVVFKKNDKNICLESSQINLVGIVKDNRDEVGKVHVGLIYVVDIDKNTNVELITNENFIGWFASYSVFMHEAVFNNDSKYKIEGWTQLILDRVLPYLI